MTPVTPEREQADSEWRDYVQQHKKDPVSFGMLASAPRSSLAELGRNDRLVSGIVRLAIVPLAIGDGDASTWPADDFKLISMHHESCTCIHPDAQHARIRGHDPG